MLRRLPNHSLDPEKEQRHREGIELQDVYNDHNAFKDEAKLRAQKKAEKALVHVEFQERGRKIKADAKAASEKKKEDKEMQAKVEKLEETKNWENEREGEILKMEKRIQRAHQKRGSVIADTINRAKAKLVGEAMRKKLNEKNKMEAKKRMQAKAEDDIHKKNMSDEFWEASRKFMSEDELAVERELEETREKMEQALETEKETRMSKAKARKDVITKKKAMHEKRLDGKRISIISRHLYPMDKREGVNLKKQRRAREKRKAKEKAAEDAASKPQRKMDELERRFNYQSDQHRIAQEERAMRESENEFHKQMRQMDQEKRKSAKESGRKKWKLPGVRLFSPKNSSKYKEGKGGKDGATRSSKYKEGKGGKDGATRSGIVQVSEKSALPKLESASALAGVKKGAAKGAAKTTEKYSRLPPSEKYTLPQW
jgi:hypothetical protein